MKDTHCGWTYNANSFLMCRFVEFACEILRDAFCNNGYGPNLEIKDQREPLKLPAKTIRSIHYASDQHLL